MSVHQKPDGRWYAAFRDENRKWRCKYFGRGDDAEKEARAYDKELEAERIRGNRPKAPTAQLYFDELCQKYVDERRLKGASTRYIHDLLNLLNHRIGPRFKDRTVESIQYEEIIKVFNELWPNPDNNPSRHATRQRYLTYLKAIFRFGIEHDHTTNNPLRKWKKSKEKKRRFYLTVEDLQKIIESAEHHLYWALIVEWNLGTRPGTSELFALKWSDIDFENGKVNVYGSKTKEDRSIPISEEFAKMLRAKKQDAKTDYIIEYKGRPIKKLRRSFQTACKKASIEYPVRMYDIRHLFASTMLKGGADLAAVSKLLGHASINQTQEAYYELLKGAKEEAVLRLPKIDIEEKPKKESISGRKNSSEQAAPIKSEPDQSPPIEKPTSTQEPAQILSIEDFKKRMLVRAVGQ
jgi:integrase